MLRFLSIALVALALGAPAQGGEGIFYHAKLFCPQDGCPLEAIRQEVGQSVGARPKLCGHPIQSKNKLCRRTQIV